MATISELVVKAKPEGVDETTDSFESMQGQLDETRQEMDDTTESMNGLANQWKGAMGAIVAGFAVATAGLLSKVPVLGQVMGSLGMVLDSLAFKLDKDLRPVLGPLSGEFADLANEIHKEDGFLAGLDAIAEKVGELGMDAIQFSLEGDKLKGGVDKIIEFVFPTISEKTLINAVFDIDLSSTAVLTTLFAGLALTATKLLKFVLPASISPTALLLFFLPVIGVSAILSHVFNINMTKTAILGAIFGGVIIAAAGVLGAISWPIIAAGAIIGTLFAGVTIKATDIINAIVSQNAPNANVREGRQKKGTLMPDYMRPGLFGESAQQNGRFAGLTGPSLNATTNPGTGVPEGFSVSKGEPRIFMDGREVTQENGRYRRDAVSRRGRDG